MTLLRRTCRNLAAILGGLVDRTNELYSGHAILRDGSA